ncbi:MAG: S49 family peptidase, partial [Nitrososphaera sp.]|nr:S49 family peptidase [Nitrososphaera sp.]
AGMLIVFDCHGGDLVTADRLWSVLHHISGQIPVVAYVRHATSAGYYVASAATRICLNPLGITGSIGTMTVRFDVSEIMERAGVHIGVVHAGQGPLIGPVGGPFGEDELSMLRRRSQVAHALFIERIAQGRSMNQDRLTELGDGRLLDAEAALSSGLVDQIGGILDALSMLRTLAQVDEMTPVEISAHQAVHRLSLTSLFQSSLFQSSFLINTYGEVAKIGRMLYDSLFFNVLTR